MGRKKGKMEKNYAVIVLHENHPVWDHCYWHVALRDCGFQNQMAAKYNSPKATLHKYVDLGDGIKFGVPLNETNKP